MAFCRPFKSAVGAFHHFENQVAQRVDEITDGVEKELVFQNENPVKVLTSGFEQRATEKFYAGGKWREVRSYSQARNEAVVRAKTERA